MLNFARKDGGVRLDTRLASYGAMAVAAALGGATPARAAVIVHDIPDITLGFGDFVSFNVQTGATSQTNSSLGQFLLSVFSSSFFSSSFFEAVFLTPWNSGDGIASAGNSYAQRLIAGQTVDGNLAFSSTSQYLFLRSLTTAGSFGAGQWGNPGGFRRGFAGLRFFLNGAEHFGWADITVDDTSNLSATLHCFAYESTPNTAIRTSADCSAPQGNVPEPSSAALLALGAAGMTAYRRRRKAA
ncbi:MAG: PEP-CTERM sorting domain-containing protein [Bryobacteraceae bacterium]